MATKRKKAWIGALIGAGASLISNVLGINAQEENAERQLAMQKKLTEAQRELDQINLMNNQIGQGQDIYTKIRTGSKCGGKYRIRKDLGGISMLSTPINDTLAKTQPLITNTGFNVQPINANNIPISLKGTQNSQQLYIWTPNDTNSLITGLGNLAGGIGRYYAETSQGNINAEIQKQQALRNRKNIQQDINYKDRFDNSKYKFGGKVNNNYGRLFTYNERF